jgi:ubiquitin-like-conjugating enzyme ATG3
MSSDMTAMGYLRAAREWAMPTLKESAFLSKGVLTPQEFVKAGDELVFRCPTWQWESGDPKQAKSYLPSDKQYLITRNVPCRDRVSAMEQMLDMQAGEGDNEDWLISHIIQQGENNLEDEFDILDQEGEIVAKTPEPESTAEDAAAEEDEYADMAGYEDDNVLHDDAAVVETPQENDNLVRVRTYDLSITYDKYYQTPRVWMVGRSAEGQPLSGKEMMEDVITDYANKTVTIEGHPHVSGPHASIHPCQHAKVMKTIVKNLSRKSSKAGDGDETIGPMVEMYLFIFLKFVSSMIPTINYDFTMDVQASTQKESN